MYRICERIDESDKYGVERMETGVVKYYSRSEIFDLLNDGIEISGAIATSKRAIIFSRDFTSPDYKRVIKYSLNDKNGIFTFFGDVNYNKSVIQVICEIQMATLRIIYSYCSKCKLFGLSEIKVNFPVRLTLGNPICHSSVYTINSLKFWERNGKIYVAFRECKSDLNFVLCIIDDEVTECGVFSRKPTGYFTDVVYDLNSLGLFHRDAITKMASSSPVSTDTEGRNNKTMRLIKDDYVLAIEYIDCNRQVTKGLDIFLPEYMNRRFSW